MGVAGAHAGVVHVGHAGQAHVAAAHQHAAVLEAPGGPVADRPAQVVTVQGGVDEIILPVELPHGAGLAEGLDLVGGALGLLPGEHVQIVQFVPGDDGEHIAGVQLEPHGSLSGGLGAVQQDGVAAEGKAGVQVQPPVLIHETAGVELEGLSPLADRGAVLVLHVAVEFVFPRWLVAHRHRDHFGAAHEIVEVIPPVRTLYHVRGGQAVGHPDPGGGGVLLPLEDTAVIGPVPQIVHRGGPAHVVPQAEVDAVEQIVGAVYVHPAVHDVGLGVWNVLPAGQIGVERLSCLHKKSSFFGYMPGRPADGVTLWAVCPRRAPTRSSRCGRRTGPLRAHIFSREYHPAGPAPPGRRRAGPTV